MADIVPATERDVAAVIELESQLFAEDAGVHERHADVEWPRRHGHDDFRDLLASDDGIVLLARDAGEHVGLLMGAASTAGPTREPIRSATLRTMYVAYGHRSSGVGTALIERFLLWARQRGCVEAQVNHYVANPAAGRLYERLGFEAHSLNRVLHLD